MAYEHPYTATELRKIGERMRAKANSAGPVHFFVSLSESGPRYDTVTIYIDGEAIGKGKTFDEAIEAAWEGIDNRVNPDDAWAILGIERAA